MQASTASRVGGVISNCTRALSLVLQDHCPDGYTIAMAHVVYAQTYQVEGGELAVDTQIEQCQLPESLLHLQAHSDSPDLFELERRLLTDKLALIPRFVLTIGMSGFHGDLLVVEGDPIVDQVTSQGLCWSASLRPQWSTAPRGSIDP